MGHEASVRCREIAQADHAQVVALLTKGFASFRDASFWEQALRRLGERSLPAGFPRFGYALEHAGAIVGVLLLIASEVPQAGLLVPRCNVSSWYIEPKFRLYGTLLVHRILRQRAATILNVSPAPHTWPVLEAQGYKRYVSGRSFSFPLLARAGGLAKVRIADPSMQSDALLPQHELALLLDHRRWGCLSLVCEHGGERLTFVLGLRRRKGIRFAYLLYCRDLASFASCAGPLGRFLARRGIAFVVADSDGPIPGMPSWYQGRLPKFFLGPVPPRAGDLAYTERAIFGV